MTVLFIARLLPSGGIVPMQCAQRETRSGHVSVGAGVVMGGVGTLVDVVMPSPPETEPPETERPSSFHRQRRGRPQGSPPHIPTTPAPTGTMGLLPKNLYL